MPLHTARLLLVLPLALLPMVAMAAATANAAAIAAAAAHLRLDEPAEALRWLDVVPAESREWEWDLLHARADHSVASRDDYPESLVSIALQPEQRAGIPQSLAVGCAAGDLLLQDPKSFQMQARLAGHTDAVYSLRWDPTGAVLLSASRDTSVRIWRGTGPDWTSRPLFPSGNPVAAADWTTDGKSILTASYRWNPDGGCIEGIVQRFDATSGEELGEPLVAGQGHPLSSLEVTADGQYATVGSWGGTAFLIDLASWTITQEYVVPSDEEYYGAINAVAVDPHGQWFAMAGNESRIEIFDLASGAHQMSLTEPHGPLWTLAVSDDGLYLAAGGEADQIEVYLAGYWLHVATLNGHRQTVRALAFGSDSDTLFSGAADHTVRQWDIAVPPRIDLELPYQSSGASVRFNRDGDQLLTSTYAGEVSIWTAADNESPRLQWTADPEGLNLATWSTDGRFVATCDWSGRVTLWSIDPSLKSATLESEKRAMGGTSYLAFSPDGLELAVAGMTGKLLRWAIPSLQTIVECDGEVPILAVAWHPDNTTIAGALQDGGIAVWGSGNCVATRWSAHPPRCETVAFSPDGRLLATGGGDSMVRCWDWKTRMPVWETSAHESPVYRVAWHPEGKRLAIASDHVQILDASTGELLLTEEMPWMVWDLGFSPDGRRLGACTSIGQFRLWDATDHADRIAMNPAQGAPDV